MHHSIRRVSAALIIFLASAGVSADWALDGEASRLSFISTKNASKAESHYFKELSGSISDAGEARVEAPLDSVETAIPIRNERMREYLFETGRFPALAVTAKIDPAMLAAAAGVVEDVPITVTLHGQSVTYSAALVVASVVASEGETGVSVTSREPILVNAADFDLAGGIGKLQELAGLSSISTAVPVSAHLVFRSTP